MWIPMVLALSVLPAPKGVQFYEGSWESALDQAAKEKKLVFADFYTDW